MTESEPSRHERSELQSELESLRGKLSDMQQQNASLTSANRDDAARIVELAAELEKDRTAAQEMHSKSQKAQSDAVQRACHEQAAKFKSELATQAAEREAAVQELRTQLESTAQAAQKRHNTQKKKQQKNSTTHLHINTTAHQQHTNSTPTAH